MSVSNPEATPHTIGNQPRGGGAGGGGTPDPHAASHSENATDEVKVENLGTLGTSGEVPTGDGLGGLTMESPTGGAPDPHAASHQNGGGDEVSVVGLSGELADPQPPKMHAASHSDGGTDEVTVENLATAGTSGQVPTSDGLGGLTMETPVDTGEVNTTSNDGAGEGLAKAKVGVDLPFKSLVEGTHVNLLGGVDTVTIDNEPTGTTVAAATFTVLTGHAALEVDYTATGACTITIDTDNAVAGRHFFITDTGGNAQTNNITVNTEGTEEINGETSAIMAGNYESWEVYSDGTDFFIR